MRDLAQYALGTENKYMNTAGLAEDFGEKLYDCATKHRAQLQPEKLDRYNEIHNEMHGETFLRTHLERYATTNLDRVIADDEVEKRKGEMINEARNMTRTEYKALRRNARIDLRERKEAYKTN